MLLGQVLKEESIVPPSWQLSAKGQASRDRKAKKDLKSHRAKKQRAREWEAAVAAAAANPELQPPMRRGDPGRPVRLPVTQSATRPSTRSRGAASGGGLPLTRCDSTDLNEVG